MINIKSIWDAQKPTRDIIIKTRINEVSHLKCFAATNSITGGHLFILNISKNVEMPNFKNFKFKGVKIFTIELDDIYELTIYLLENDLKDIFSLFIENIIGDIMGILTEKEILNKVLNVISKWKKLFDKINFQGLSITQQKGLVGELLFINFLIDKNISISKVLTSWTGPNYDNRDFLFGSVGVEIKFTSSKLPKLQITSERQLDTQSLTELFLILYSTEEVKDNGFSLNSMVHQIRKKLESNDDSLKFFNEQLLLIGYLDEENENYNQLYSLRKMYFYSITHEFPKITSNQLSLGIYNVSYNIELSAVETFLIDSTILLNKI